MFLPFVVGHMVGGLDVMMKQSDHAISLKININDNYNESSKYRNKGKLLYDFILLDRKSVV